MRLPGLNVKPRAVAENGFRRLREAAVGPVQH
jgi:hypothetical protein